MVKSILNWVDMTFEKAVEDENTTRGFAKCFGLGAIEGAIDAAAVLGTVCLVGTIISAVKK